ncbi:MAG: cobalamin-binding protein [Candidatus Omnitrophica bacterium]|nr:cobalamin-binding protein [Candidatus Omnitrophota bacterium]MDD5027347.1 cobalamin-binding protein [Candidatus Omnitrophota bacterium]MDD5661708.1 cobalamin-binding protein [Candidatus Omnitrophota bacterium]
MAKKIILILVFVFFILSSAQAASRYISLAPSTTEILFALGLGEDIVGVSSYCNYPPETKNKAKVGDFSHPNIEKIISLRPDYVFCTGLEQAPVIEELKYLKFNTYIADPADTEELFKTITDIGAITHREKEASALIRKMKDDIVQIEADIKVIPQAKRVKVFVEIWHEPLMTAGRGSIIDEVITLAGGINIAHDVKRPYCNFSAEKVVRLDPQVIILAYMDRESPLKLVEGRFGWANISAVKNRRVFNDIDPELLLRPTPRITEGLKKLYKKLYPVNE